MTDSNTIAVEYWWLAVTGLVMAVTSLPYVLDRLVTAGIAKSFGNPQDNDTQQSAWAIRMKAAHYNCVENMVVFGPLCVAVVVAGVADATTAMAAAGFCLSRIAYVVVYTLGIPVLRTLAFLVGWLSTLVLALRLLGLL